MNKKLNSFSVPLGLLDYINPIFYAITTFTIMHFMQGRMDPTIFMLFKIGAILSLVVGMIIPTGKLIVGLGIIEFVMPVILVYLVNTGILLSGLMLFKTVIDPSNIIFGLLILVILVLLGLVYKQTKKFNTVAVLNGMAGYLLVYISLITLSIQNKFYVSVICYALAICLFVFLGGVGIKANLKDPRVHWVIEICNVICQGCVALGTLLLFGVL